MTLYEAMRDNPHSSQAPNDWPKQDIMLKFILALIMLITPLFLHTAQAGQKKKTFHGPVISAYLANLEEELNELEFQIRHQEINRRDYERARARLLIQQRYVPRLAGERGEDIVPELQVLTSDELAALMLGAEGEVEQVRLGTVLADNWKIIGIEQRSDRYFVMERASLNKANNKSSNQLSKQINPLDVIETVRVEEPEEKNATTNRAVAEAAPVKMKREEPPTVQPMIQEARPQIRSLYLPRYTTKAREKGIEGKVILNALFGRDGKVKDILFENKLGYGLDESALAAAKQIIFEPARVGGQPIDSRAQVIFTFVQNNVIARIQPLPATDKKGN